MKMDHFAQEIPLKTYMKRQVWFLDNLIVKWSDNWA